tara:strand:+ start:489 stop:728 length:240 start_codon:yes stop_codon:yes gene_type:complete
MTTEQRPIYEIAEEIRKDWRPVWYGAVPYLDAMRSLDNVREKFGADSGESIVLYFLSNAQTWRGETARRVKKELKALVK